MKVCFIFLDFPATMCPQYTSYMSFVIFLYTDELPGFEESWKGNAGQHLPGWNQNAGISNGDNSGNI